MNSELLQTYLVTDEGQLHGRDFFAVIEEALQGGITLLQLREKNGTSKEFYEKAVKLKELSIHYHVPLIINDRVDIAIAVDADGVHVGQMDLPVTVVRNIIGQDKIVGVTANTAALAVKAQREGADYVGAGAMFPTGTKKDTTALAIDKLQEITASITIPVVAIGGITVDNASQLVGSGIAGVAVSSGILGADTIAEAAKALRNIKF